MKKIKSIIILLTISSLFCANASISQSNSMTVAKNIFKQFSETKNIDDFDVQNVDIIKSEDSRDLMYIYNLNPRGFIIVSASNKSLPCLAYSFESDFSLIPTPVQEIMGTYKREIAEQLKSVAPAREDIQQKWNLYLSENPAFPETRDVQPLIDAEFGQSGGWNNGVTSELGFNGPVGCVAVAMSQVMHYWGHPSSGEGSNSYVEDDFGEIEVNFSQSLYEFESMNATVPSSPSQLLLFDTGVSVNMDYDQSGSGAWVVGSYPSTEYSLEFFFKYDSSIYSMYKTPSNESVFGDALYESLDMSMPVILRGYDADYGGHAWNVDGYQGDNYQSFHCNFGWGGSSNGYYSMTSMGGFPDDQAAIFNIFPRDLENPMALYEYEVDASTVYFTDLSTIFNEEELRNFYWDFGDGTTQVTTTGEINYTFELSGDYSVELIVENIYGMMSEPFAEVISVQAAMPGDLTQDGNIDILDIVSMIGMILGEAPTGSQLFIGDLNSDGVVNIQDVILLIGMVLSGQ
jgi:hypothetical protein